MEKTRNYRHNRKQKTALGRLTTESPYYFVKRINAGLPVVVTRGVDSRKIKIAYSRKNQIYIPPTLGENFGADLMYKIKRKLNR